MSDCCTKTPTPSSRKRTCSECGRDAVHAKWITLKHQLKYPNNMHVDEANDYFFCANPGCETVYFDSNGQSIFQDDLRVTVGQKSQDPQRLVCYCFGITRADIEAETVQGKTLAKEFVEHQTKTKQCACQLRNPSGKCCLSDF